MAFASIYEQASSAFILSNTSSSDQMCLASTLENTHGQQRGLRKSVFHWPESLSTVVK